MKTIFNLIFAISMLFFVVACGGHKEEHTHSHDASAIADSNFGLTLNGTEKWQMDDHTRAMFAQMSERWKSINPDALPANELKMTGADLRRDVDSLIAGCTMQGAAHDELHTYLTAFIPAVEALSQQGQEEQARKVDTLLALYPRYFK